MKQSILFHKGIEKLRLYFGLKGKRRFPIYYKPLPESLYEAFLSILEEVRSLNTQVFRIDIDAFRDKAERKADLTPYLCFIPVLGWLLKLKPIREYFIVKRQ